MLKQAHILYLALIMASLYNLALTPSTEPAGATWDTGIVPHEPYPEDNLPALPSTAQMPRTPNSLKNAWFIFTVLFLLLFAVSLLLCCLCEIHKRRLNEQIKQAQLLQGHDSRVTASVRLLDHGKPSRFREYAGGYSPGNQKAYLLARLHPVSSPNYGHFVRTVS